jgi:hypothetical protein
MTDTYAASGAPVMAVLLLLPALTGVLLLVAGRRADRGAGTLAVLATSAALVLRQSSPRPVPTWRCRFSASCRAAT